ncbi:MAG: phosphopentomutase, partial [Acutalibacteraceae bacterium]
MMPSLTCQRIFLIVLDSFGIGELPDAAAYGDAGSNTLASISHSPAFRADTLQRLGLFNIEGVDCREGVNAPLAAYGRCVERSKGKDTTTGHWEIAGLVSDHPLPTYPDGFPAEVLDAFT